MSKDFDRSAMGYWSQMKDLPPFVERGAWKLNAFYILCVTIQYGGIGLFLWAISR